MQVSRVRTVVDPTTYAHAFGSAWRILGYPTLPTREQCGVLWSQYMIETGGKACWNWNIGNVKVTQSQIDAGVPWFDLPGTWEIIAGKRVTLPDGHPGRRFRAFASLNDAMREHLAFLRSKRYARCWPYVESGSPEGFARALKAGADGIEGTRDDYYTASSKEYADGMRRHFDAWMRSSAFDAAIAKLLAASEAETLPELPSRRPPAISDFAVVHPSVPLGRPALDSEPDDVA